MGGRGSSSGASNRGTFNLSLRSGGTKRVTGRIISSGGQKLGIHKSDSGREWYITDVTTGTRIAGSLGEFSRLKDAMNYVNSDKGKAMIREYSEIKTKLKTPRKN